MGFKLSRYCLPYSLHKQKDGSWIFLNRIYKPLGVLSNDLVDYREYPSFRFESDPTERLRKIGINQVVAIDGHIHFFLYEDRTGPFIAATNTKEYFKRLEQIMSWISKPQSQASTPTT